ncbi:MAG: UspA domain-containing protein [Methylocystaceae bacterium]|nr:MAG: UspA domain-containing protein [Methylocystaceae bacterium]KAF0212451.1 MAG: UspA domain-containing [Methylocystaceae bacterium]TXT43681.1 MAG: UspA domain-containing protein [Methylocystaceae bacterium]
MFKKILLPIDLEEAEMTRQAIEAAIEIASPDAELRLVSVQTMAPTTFVEYAPPDYEGEVRLVAEKHIAETAARINCPRERVSTIVRIGAVYDEALIEAGEWGADLIVICSNRPTLATYLLGSNAAKIVRHATCSVLVVRK